MSNSSTYTPGSNVNCPHCGRGVAVTADRGIARHGHRVVSGIRGGHCPGTGSHSAAHAVSVMVTLAASKLDALLADAPEGALADALTTCPSTRDGGKIQIAMKSLKIANAKAAKLAA